MDSGIVTEAAFLLLIVGVAIYVVILYNELVRLRNDNDRAWANIDVLLKQRHEEIPNLVETVKGYMQHEQQTLLAVTQARAASMNSLWRIDSVSPGVPHSRNPRPTIKPSVTVTATARTIFWRLAKMLATATAAIAPRLPAIRTNETTGSASGSHGHVTTR